MPPNRAHPRHRPTRSQAPSLSLAGETGRTDGGAAPAATGMSGSATAGSGTSTARISQQQAQKMIEQDGYSGVKNLHQSGDGGWSANATANGKPVTVKVSTTGDVRAQVLTTVAVTSGAYGRVPCIASRSGPATLLSRRRSAAGEASMPRPRSVTDRPARCRSGSARPVSHCQVCCRAHAESVRSVPHWVCCWARAP